MSKRQTTGLVVCADLSFRIDRWTICQTSCLSGSVNVADFARVLVLDKWTCNADGRQAVFHHKTPRSRRYTATFVDQGYCFNAGEWTFPDYPLRGVYATNCVYQGVTGWEAFEPALTGAEEMDLDAIWRCAADIPEEWYEGDRDGLHRLVEDVSAVDDASFGDSSACFVSRRGTRFQIGVAVRFAD